MTGKLKPWNDPPGARETAKAKGKKLETAYAAKNAKRRAAPVPAKHTAWRKIGPR